MPARASRPAAWVAYGLVANLACGLLVAGNPFAALAVVLSVLVVSAALWSPTRRAAARRAGSSATPSTGSPATRPTGSSATPPTGSPATRPTGSPAAPPDIAHYPEALAELTRSRREIVAAFEIERRRIERDLHDGAQQYIVAASMKLGEASLQVPADTPPGRLLAAAQDDIDVALAALRRTVHGIHPQVLSDLGLQASVCDLAGRMPGVQVRCPHPLPTLPQGVVAAGYFFVSEALTNAAKYAPDAAVTVLLACDDQLRISVIDDGPGGASLRPGHGLSGMRERLAAFGGTLTISSPSGGPTQLMAAMPILLHCGQSAIGRDHSQAPGVAYKQPGVAYQRPAVADQEPGVAYQRPGVADQEPGDS